MTMPPVPEPDPAQTPRLPPRIKEPGDVPPAPIQDPITENPEPTGGA